MTLMKIKDPSIPPGEYHVNFLGVEETFHEEWREGLMWKFKVYKGEFRVKETRRTTGVEPTPGNACGRMLAGLADKSPTEGLDIDPDDFIGRKYVVDVVANKSGKGTRVERILRPVEGDETESVGDTDEQAADLF
jgi:hypothetical protein